MKHCAYLLLLLATCVNAQDLYPFVTGDTRVGDIDNVLKKIKNDFQQEGVIVLGEYLHSRHEVVLLVTESLYARSIADTGDICQAFAIPQRIAFLQVGSNVQITYLNPQYHAALHGVRADVGEVEKVLKSVIGFKGFFGGQRPRTKKEVEDFLYMFDGPAICDVEKAVVNRGDFDVVYQYRSDDGATILNGIKTHGQFEKDITNELGRGDHTSLAFLPFSYLTMNGVSYFIPARAWIAAYFPDMKLLPKGSEPSFYGIKNTVINIDKIFHNVEVQSHHTIIQ